MAVLCPKKGLPCINQLAACCLFDALYLCCRGRAVINVGKTCGPTPCLIVAINTCTFKLFLLAHCVLKFMDQLQNTHLRSMTPIS